MRASKEDFFIAGFLTLFACSANHSLLGESLPTREEVLQSVYPGASYQAERVFLTEDQLKDAALLAKSEIPSPLLARYIVTREGATVGRGYIDTHVIRSKKESLLVCLSPDGKVVRIEVTAFQEPPEYRAPPNWFNQFSGRQLDQELRLQRGIRPLTGATLTATSVSTAVRRVLALDSILSRRGESP